MFFDDYAKKWDTDRRINRAKIISEEISNSIEINKEYSAMEFGCGTGLISFNLVEKFENITLIDSSKGMIDVVKEKIEKYGVDNMKPYAIDLFNEEIIEKFDLIYTSMVLHHIQDISGLANRGWIIKNTLDTRFRIASVSKMFTSVAILQLIEKGQLDFETKVVEYLDLRDTKISNEVTVENLLTHTSGIGDYFDESLGDEEWEKMWRDFPIYKMRSNLDYLPLFINKDQINKPGEKYHYNGAGYILLGLIIEKASGIS